MADEYAGPERRKYQRLESPLFIFSRLEGDNSFKLSKALSKNVSGGGLMFETEDAVHVGSILYLEVYLQSGPNEDMIYSIYAQAKVVWVNRKENVSMDLKSIKYQIGLEFIEIKTEDRERIIEYVERIRKINNKPPLSPIKR